MKLTLIKHNGIRASYLEDCLSSWQLVPFLAWRSILLRYKETTVGIVWALIKPVTALLIFSTLFGKIAGFESDGAPYVLFCLVALIFWQLIANMLNEGGRILLEHKPLLSKVYFPRIILICALALSYLIDLLIGVGFLLMLYPLYGWPLPATAVLVVFPLFLCLFLGIGLVLWTSALSLLYRDFHQALPFLVQLSIYVSPVAFSSRMISEEHLWLYSLNPLVGVIDTGRYVLLGSNYPFPWVQLFVSLVVTSGIFYSGLRYFLRNEAIFSEYA